MEKVRRAIVVAIAGVVASAWAGRLLGMTCPDDVLQKLDAADRKSKDEGLLYVYRTGCQGALNLVIKNIGDQEVMESATAAAGRLRAVEAVPAILLSLERGWPQWSGDSDPMASVTLALAKICGQCQRVEGRETPWIDPKTCPGDEKCISLLLKRAEKSESESEKVAIMGAISRLKRPEVEKVAITALDDSSWAVRLAAVDIVARLSSQEAQRALVRRAAKEGEYRL